MPPRRTSNFAAELADGLREVVGHVPFAVDLERAPGEVEPDNQHGVAEYLDERRADVVLAFKRSAAVSRPEMRTAGTT